MKGDVPVRDLGPAACEPLRQAVAGLDRSAWQADVSRQDAFEVHRATESVLLLFVDAEQWPRLSIRRAAGWDALGPVAQPLIDSLIGAHYATGGVVLRAMVVRLPAAGRIAPHRDKHASFQRSHRLHVPLATNGRVRFLVDGVPWRLAEGRAYELDNQRTHSVLNNGPLPRDHLIFDYLPPAHLAAPGLARA